MSKRRKTLDDQKTGRPEIPISNGFQMNMEKEFKDRVEIKEGITEFAEETNSFGPTIVRDKNNKKRKPFNVNDAKPNFKSKSVSKKK